MKTVVAWILPCIPCQFLLWRIPTQPHSTCFHYTQYTPINLGLVGGQIYLHLCYYRPQRRRLSVILFTGGVSERHPRADTPWVDTAQADTAPGRHPPPPTATAADGTHPTGMHSCLQKFSSCRVRLSS